MVDPPAYFATAAIVLRWMIEHDQPVYDPIANLAALFTARSGRASYEATATTLRVVGSNPYSLARLVSLCMPRRGWGRSLRRAVAKCLNQIDLATILEQPDHDFGDGITLRHLIRRAHPKSSNEERMRAYYDLASGL